MQIEKKEKYTLITARNIPFDNIYQELSKTLKSYQKQNIILEISEYNTLKTEDFLLFLDIAQEKKENGTSFVIVNSNTNADDFPEYFNIVPTLIEAEDIIEMESIERELGF